VWSGGFWAGVARSALWPWNCYYSCDNTTYWAVDKACQELGYRRGQAFFGKYFAPAGAPRWLSGSCSNDTLASISDCTWSTVAQQGSSSDDTNIVCSNNTSGAGQ